MSTKISETEFSRNLAQFTGTENWYKVMINPRVLYTDGVKYVADTCGCYWLLDSIASHQYEKKFREEEFQVWKFVADVAAGKGVLTCGDGNGNTVYTKEISFTDFPYPEIELWLTDNVILLKSEY